MALKRTVRDITIERSGNGLEIEWAIVGPAGRFDFAATPDGTLRITEAGLQRAGVTDREAVLDKIWDFTPAEVRAIAVDGEVVRTR